MKSGFFLPFSSSYKLVWLWGVILLSFERVLFYEIQSQTLILTILAYLSYTAFIVLIWPHRFIITDEHLYFASFPRLKMSELELKYIVAVRTSKTGVSFSYAGRRYRFVAFGKAKDLLAELEAHGEKNEKMAQLQNKSEA